MPAAVGGSRESTSSKRLDEGIGPSVRHLVGTDVGHSLGTHLPQLQPTVRADGDDGLALLRQQPLVGVQADDEDPHWGTIAQQLRDPGQRAQSASAIKDDNNVVRKGDGGGLAHRVPACRHHGDELPDPATHRLVVRADQRHGVLAIRGPGVRQPAHPLPVAPRRRIRKQA
jgi:hypothetical protein